MTNNPQTAASSARVNGWTTTSTTLSNEGFHPAVGTFTVPRDGVYRLSASCNVGLTAAASTSLGTNVVPSLVLRGNGTPIAVSSLTIFDVNVALILTLRTVLQSSVSLDTTTDLTAGDELNLNYEDGGMTQEVRMSDCQFSATELS